MFSSDIGTVFPTPDVDLMRGVISGSRWARFSPRLSRHGHMGARSARRSAHDGACAFLVGLGNHLVVAEVVAKCRTTALSSTDPRTPELAPESVRGKTARSLRVRWLLSREVSETPRTVGSRHRRRAELAQARARAHAEATPKSQHGIASIAMRVVRITSHGRAALRGQRLRTAFASAGAVGGQRFVGDGRQSHTTSHGWARWGDYALCRSVPGLASVCQGRRRNTAALPTAMAPAATMEAVTIEWQALWQRVRVMCRPCRILASSSRSLWGEAEYTYSGGPKGSAGLGDISAEVAQAIVHVARERTTAAEAARLLQPAGGGGVDGAPRKDCG